LKVVQNNHNENNMTNKDTLRATSKFMSFVLRHQPEAIGLALDSAGWASIDELLARMAAAGRRVSRGLLQEVVDTNDKQRFAISDDGLRIRASQGHSVDIDLGLMPAEPPDLLYHGTATRFRAAIFHEGLKRQQRHHVHLSESIDTALAVGSRYGVVVLLQVDARRMRDDGHVFYKSDNNVWLTDHVPVAYLTECKGEKR
jgi:putative RNA 2'-phosphotransferase